MRIDKENVEGEPAAKTARKDCRGLNCDEPEPCSVDLTKDRLSRSGLEFSNCQETAVASIIAYYTNSRIKLCLLFCAMNARPANDNKFYRPVNAQLLQRCNHGDASAAALSAANGLPRKGQKSVTQKVLSTRYPAVVSTHLPASVTSDMANTVDMIDGMFTLQVLLLTQHR